MKLKKKLIKQSIEAIGISPIYAKTWRIDGNKNLQFSLYLCLGKLKLLTLATSFIFQEAR